MKTNKQNRMLSIKVYLLCLLVLNYGTPPGYAQQGRGRVRPGGTAASRTLPKTTRPSSVNTNINIDRSRDIQVNNSRHVNNTVVINNRMPYTRPPVVYGGRSYYAFHPYVYHPYHPFYWGPAYHPWGYFIASLTLTAIVISVASRQYHYDQGVYYTASNGGYTVVQAPVGAVITTLPAGSQTIVVNETKNYYYGGTFYKKTDKGYQVVTPAAGTIVENLPDGGKETKIGDITYVKYGETYYQPITQDGKNKYEVVLVKTQP